jgi:UMF1 family MFS transporter
VKVGESVSDGTPGQGRAKALGAGAWALFQFAAAPYFVMVNIFVFAAYFQKAVVGDYVTGQQVWGYIQGLSGLLVALFSPVLGALADAAGPRKPGLLFFTLASCLAMFSLWFAVPGAIILASAAVLVCAFLMEFAGVYHNAMLTSVSTERNVGWLSGVAFSLDYLGSVTLFVIWLALPVWGLVPQDQGGHEHERLVGPLAAVWCLVFMMPLFLFAPDRPSVGVTMLQAIGAGLTQLSRTLRRVGHYRNVAVYLGVRAIYADGMSGVFTFLAGFIGATFGWSFEKIGLYALLVLTVPIFTSALAGYVDDWIGSKRTIQISLAGFTLGVLGSLSVTQTEYLFVLPVSQDLMSEQIPILGVLLSVFGFVTFPEQLSLAFSMLGAAFVGPVLASSRTMVARLSPPDMISELYGLYNLTGKATAVLVPTLVAFVTGLTGDVRQGFSVVIVFLVAGLIGMAFVREERATKAGY